MLAATKSDAPSLLNGEMVGEADLGHPVCAKRYFHVCKFSMHSRVGRLGLGCGLTVTYCGYEHI